MPTVRVTFSGPGPQANGLAAAADGLWICDQNDHKVYLVRYDDGAILTSFSGPGRNLSGIAWGGYAVWTASNTRPSVIYRHDPWTGQTVAAVPLPEADQGGVHGIEWADDTLWVTRPGLRVIQQIRADTGEKLHDISFPASRSHGLYWEADSRTITCVETNNHHVYRLNVANGAILAEFVIDGFEPHGMTRDPWGRVWLCDATTNRIGILEI